MLETSTSFKKEHSGDYYEHTYSKAWESLHTGKTEFTRYCESFYLS